MGNSFFTDNYMIYFTVGTILSSVSHFIILIASIFLVGKIKKTATYLILTGAILKTITLILGVILPHIYGVTDITSMQGINSILIGLSLSLFAVGFILFSMQLAKENTKL